MLAITLQCVRPEDHSGPRSNFLYRAVKYHEVLRLVCGEGSTLLLGVVLDRGVLKEFNDF